VLRDRRVSEHSRQARTERVFCWLIHAFVQSLHNPAATRLGAPDLAICHHINARGGTFCLAHRVGATAAIYQQCTCRCGEATLPLACPVLVLLPPPSRTDKCWGCMRQGRSTSVSLSAHPAIQPDTKAGSVDTVTALCVCVTHLSNACAGTAPSDVAAAQHSSSRQHSTSDVNQVNALPSLQPARCHSLPGNSNVLELRYGCRHAAGWSVWCRRRSQAGEVLPGMRQVAGSLQAGPRARCPCCCPPSPTSCML